MPQVPCINRRKVDTYRHQHLTHCRITRNGRPRCAKNVRQQVFVSTLLGRQPLLKPFTHQRAAFCADNDLIGPRRGHQVHTLDKLVHTVCPHFDTKQIQYFSEKKSTSSRWKGLP